MLTMTLDFVYAVGLSLALGSVVGLERQWHRRLVDLKTNALVSLGACLFMLVTKTDDGFNEPVRMAAQIVVGVGFIGGGLLFREGGYTKGINTAATLWCCAAVGTLCGLERWLEATVASLVIVVANTTLRNLAQRLNLKMGVNDTLTHEVHLNLSCSPIDAPEIRREVESLLMTDQAEVRGLNQKSMSESETMLTFIFSFEHGNASNLLNTLLDHIAALRVSDVSWSHA
jgi:putative Mg2+ transporter-C (MgtC) family protein